MTKSVLVTTHDDSSLELMRPFVGDIYYYNDINLQSPAPTTDLVYFRDPFNDLAHPTTEERLGQVLHHFFAANPSCKSIDGYRQVSDFYTEDKWQQYQSFGTEFMPETWPADEVEFIPGEMILKKRISCRCRDIFFDQQNSKEINLQDYIAQRRVKISEEMRVFFVRGEVFRTAAIRSSKTETSKVKVKGFRELTDDEVDFIHAAMRKIPALDFVGVDLGILDDGRKIIIEYNRSPQFAGFYKVTGINIAKKLFL